MKWLEKAFENHDERLLFARVLVAYDGLRDDPRFQELEQRIFAGK